MDVCEESPTSMNEEEEENFECDSVVNSVSWTTHSANKNESDKSVDVNINDSERRDKSREDRRKTLDSKQLEKDKQLVYRHPLFPLLALLLEKCEQATATLGTNDDLNISEDSLNSDIKSFIAHQQKANKNLLGDNSEVDALMITAIQVLRIHLLELEKVQELCKDFCQRYICCLRGKMNSDNLLRDANGLHNNSSMDNTDSTCSSSEGDDNSSDFSSHPLNEENKINNAIRKDFVGSFSGPSQKDVPHTSKSPKLSCRSSSIKVDSGTEGDLSDDASSIVQKRNHKRGILPKHATSILRSWLFQHIVHPYPTEEEKKAIAVETNLTLLQVNNWFINARRRILQPMLDSANISGEGKSDSQDNESGKDLTQSPLRRLKLNAKSASFQRFWPESVSNAIKIRDSTKDLRSK